MKLPEGAVRDGTEVVVFGGPDYYPGSATASPSFSFRCTRLRLAGEGDLLAQLAELRRKLSAEGLFEPQKRLPRPALPRTIGIVTGRGSAAEADLLAGLARRSWAGRAVFAHPPVQDRHAAPKIARALSDLAAVPEVEVIVVARGGGSLADLWAFCDETLCRTVALLRVPVVSAVGHESDRTLLDDVAAVCCSTPTHAIEEAVRVDVAVQRRRLAADGRARLAVRGRDAGRGARPSPRRRSPAPSAITPTASAAACTRRSARSAPRRPGSIARGNRVDVSRRASSSPASGPRRSTAPPPPASGSASGAAALDRHAGAAATARGAELKRIAQTLAAHEPERVLERGYAIVSDAGGDDVVTSAGGGARARAAPRPLQRR